MFIVKRFVPPSKMSSGLSHTTRSRLFWADAKATLTLAIPNQVYINFFEDSFFEEILSRYAAYLLVFDEEDQTLQWIN
jgi:XisH protein